MVQGFCICLPGREKTFCNFCGYISHIGTLDKSRKKEINRAANEIIAGLITTEKFKFLIASFL